MPAFAASCLGVWPRKLAVMVSASLGLATSSFVPAASRELACNLAMREAFHATRSAARRLSRAATE
eukprot:5482582-Pleurochrysis_carterae.AAC.2